MLSVSSGGTFSASVQLVGPDSSLEITTAPFNAAASAGAASYMYWTEPSVGDATNAVQTLSSGPLSAPITLDATPFSGVRCASANGDVGLIARSAAGALYGARGTLDAIEVLAPSDVEQYKLFIESVGGDHAIGFTLEPPAGLHSVKLIPHY